MLQSQEILILYSDVKSPLERWTEQPDRKDVCFAWISSLQRKCLGQPAASEEFGQLLKT